MSEICAQKFTSNSHDVFEGAAKRWLLMIFEALVKDKWFDWDILERLQTNFKFKGKDAGRLFQFLFVVLFSS